MNIKRFLSAIAASLLLASAVNLSAQPKTRTGTGERQYRMFTDLDLSAEQKEQLKALHDEMQPIRQKHWDDVKAVREKIKNELLKSDPSQNTLYGYAGELGELHKQMSKEHADHLLKVKKVLSAEQFAKLVEKEKGMGHGKGCLKGQKGKCCPEGGMRRKGKCPHADE